MKGSTLGTVKRVGIVRDPAGGVEKQYLVSYADGSNEHLTLDEVEELQQTKAARLRGVTPGMFCWTSRVACQLPQTILDLRGRAPSPQPLHLLGRPPAFLLIHHLLIILIQYVTNY